MSLKRNRDRRLDLLEAMEAAEENRQEIENRIRNLFWTVCGDYSLQIKPNVATFALSESLALYDAIKQGAFVRHFDVQELALYLAKKQMLGANGQLLTDLTQLCIDEPAFVAASAERTGVADIRRQAFRDVLDFQRFFGTVEKMRESVMCRFLGEPDPARDDVKTLVEQVERLREARDTATIIAAIDGLYNQIASPEDASAQHPLPAVLAITPQELSEHRRDFSMSDEMTSAAMEAYLKNLQDELLLTLTLKPQKQLRTQLTSENAEEPPAPNPEDVEHLHQIIVDQFGPSSLSPLEEDQVRRRLCTGVHKRCSLHFTKGLLLNPAIKSTQFLRSSMATEKNQAYFRMKKNSIHRSISMLAGMLKQVQIQSLDQDICRADHGQIAAVRLWKVGRTPDTKLFDLTRRRDDSAFVVDLLLDSSSSQIKRQPQIAVQAYIISQALSQAGIPHRVQSFFSYWDYTMVHCFRDYDEGPEEDNNVLQFRAFGENRDGLALRAVSEGLKERSEDNKILIMLSDGRPNSLGSNRPGSRRPAPYLGEDAIKDTALEVRKLRNQGIAVLGIFVGDEENLYAEKKIFGKDFTYTTNVTSFAHIVGRYLRRLMEQD